jgi:hypothetical protein
MKLNFGDPLSISKAKEGIRQTSILKKQPVGIEQEPCCAGCGTPLCIDSEIIKDLDGNKHRICNCCDSLIESL